MDENPEIISADGKRCSVELASLRASRTAPKPLLLDLFCGAGGCAMGYHRAWFDIVGVDINPQPRYPFPFIEADALDFLSGMIAGGTSALGYRLEDFQAIHASPPCQAYTLMRALNKSSKRTHPDLLAQTRTMLELARLPWVIENVPGSPVQLAIMLCGSMFGLRVRRHRLFETSFGLLAPTSCEHKPGTLAVYGDHPEDAFIHGKTMPQGATKRAPNIAAAQQAMGIDWMVWKEITQAIPPAYTEFIGKQLLRVIGGDL